MGFPSLTSQRQQRGDTRGNCARRPSDMAMIVCYGPVWFCVENEAIANKENVQIVMDIDAYGRR